MKTNERSKFTFPWIAAHISAKEGLCDSDNKNCTNFQPTKKWWTTWKKHLSDFCIRYLVFLAETTMLMLNKLMEKITVIFQIIYTLRKRCPYLELFWPVFSRIRTEYGKYSDWIHLCTTASGLNNKNNLPSWKSPITYGGKKIILFKIF